MSFDFSTLDVVPPVEVFHLVAQYNKDPHENKQNLTIGAYRTDESKPWVLPVVRRAEGQMASDGTLNHEYLSMPGLQSFCNCATELLLGGESSALKSGSVVSYHAPGGTGALRLGMEFIRRAFNVNNVVISDPTWENHVGLAVNCGYENIIQYNYWNQQDRCIDLPAMLKAIREAPEPSVIILHAAAHNPTGSDPTEEQWVEIAEAMKGRNVFPLFDAAYQGFASGDLDADAFAVRLFDRMGFPMFIAQSFSKNFGLYGERVGNLIMILRNADCVAKAQSHMDLVVRRMYSNPPAHGARIVAMVLNNKAMASEWRENLHTMTSRIKLMRQKLYEKLKALGTPGTWDHIVKQRGMFSYTGLTERQVDLLVTKYHIYLLKSGRVNMCGLSSANLDYIANAIHDVVTNSSQHDSQL